MNKRLIIILALSLTGCAGVNSEFECKATSTDSCMDMHEANEIAKSLETASTTTNNSIANSRTGIIPPKLIYQDDGKFSISSPLRKQDGVSRILIAAYVDDADNYHDTSIVNFVVRDSHWVQTIKK
ncbi:TraV family lipoprotein [Providencia sp. wls1919]|nr:TraV family lipoprotein [Providencia sp. wls1919]